MDAPPPPPLPPPRTRRTGPQCYKLLENIAMRLKMRGNYEPDAAPSSSEERETMTSSSSESDTIMVSSSSESVTTRTSPSPSSTSIGASSPSSPSAPVTVAKTIFWERPEWIEKTTNFVKSSNDVKIFFCVSRHFRPF